MASRNRGKGKPKLRDLSRAPLTFEERDALGNSLAVASQPITLAILGSVLVENDLEELLRHRLRRKDNETWLWLLSDIGSLATFHHKIAMGYALGGLLSA
jgi:hypothetical protein